MLLKEGNEGQRDKCDWISLKFSRFGWVDVRFCTYLVERFIGQTENNFSVYLKKGSRFFSSIGKICRLKTGVERRENNESGKWRN